MFYIKNFFFFILAYGLFNELYAEEKKGGMPQLDPSSYSSQLFWLFLVFILLFTLVNLFFIPKIVSLKKKREGMISQNLIEAENNNNKIDLLKDRIDKRILEAKKKAEKLTKDSLDKSNKSADTKINNLKKELDLREKKFMSDIETKQKEINKNISKYSFELSNIMYNKMLDENKDISLKDFNDLMDKN